MHLDWYIALAGLIVGFAVGLTGMGGGALMTPVLVILFGVQPLAAVSSDLVASLIMKPLGVAVHAGKRTVRWPLVAWLSLGSVPAAFSGVVFLRLLGHGQAVQDIVQFALGAVLLIAVAALVIRWVADRRSPGRGVVSPTGPIQVRRAATLAIGVVIGFVVGITSVGSGSLVIVLLLLLYPRLRGSATVGTDLAQAIPMVGSAAIAHMIFGDFRLALTLSIVIGSVPGVLLGAIVSTRSGTGFIRAALCAVLVLSGLKLVGVPTAALGAALVASLVALPAGWVVLRRRAGGRSTAGEAPVLDMQHTVREIDQRQVVGGNEARLTAASD